MEDNEILEKEFNLLKESFNNNEQDLIKKVLENLKLSDTMTYELFNILKYLKIKYGNIDILKKYENIEVKSKLQGKKIFEEIKNFKNNNYWNINCIDCNRLCEIQ